MQSISAYVRRKGDAEAGSVVLLIDDLKGGVRVYTAAYGMNGERGWMPAHGDSPVPPMEAERYIQRQADIDPDIWVVEIEDPHARYELDAPELGPRP